MSGARRSTVRRLATLIGGFLVACLVLLGGVTPARLGPARASAGTLDAQPSQPNPIAADPGGNSATFNSKLATFTPADSDSSASDFSVKITWGDGNSSSGAISGSAGDGFVVTGRHVYYSLDEFSVSVSILGPSDSSAQVSTKIIVYRPLADGAYVLGDRAAFDGLANGTFALYIKDKGAVAEFGSLTPNGLQYSAGFSGGPPPPGFGGWAGPLATLPACGDTWIGRANQPPRYLLDQPSWVWALTAVIVSSQVTKDGGTVSGDTRALAILRATVVQSTSSPTSRAIGFQVLSLFCPD